MREMLKHFPVTSILVQTAEDINQELKKFNGNKWYLNIPAWLALTPFFMVILIPTLLADSMYQAHLIFDSAWSNIMAFKDYLNRVNRDIPEGIKTIALTIALAVAAILTLNLLSGSVYLILFALKAAIAIAAVTHIGMVIKENMPYIRNAVETVKEKISAFVERQTTKVSNFFKSFSFRSKTAAGVAPAQDGQEPPTEAPVTTGYFSNISMPGNPFTWLFKSTTTVPAQTLSGMAPEETPVTSSTSKLPPPII